MNLILVDFQLEFYRYIGQKSSNWGKNPVYETQYLKVDNCKNKVQIDCGRDIRRLHIKVQGP